MPKRRREKQTDGGDRQYIADIARRAGDAARARCAQESAAQHAAQAPADPAEQAEQPAEPARKAAQPDPVPARLRELEQALGAVAGAVDMFESLLGLCERMEAKCRQAASLNDRLPAWPPLAMLHSAAVMSKRDIVGELEKLTANMARLGAEYRLLKGEQMDRGSGQEGSANG